MDNNVRLIDANALIQDAEDVLNFSMLDRINRAETIDPETLAEHLRSCGYEVRKCQH